MPSSLTFNSGDIEKSITFMATDDTVDDDGEKVKLAFGTLPTRVSAGTNSEATVSITDDDDPEVTVSYGAATYTASEGSNVTVKVTLSADPERTVEIQINKTNQGGATDGDYSGVPDSVTFNSGETEKSFTFNATHDTIDDDDESVKLAFVNLPARVTAGTPSAATVSITDDDVPAVNVSYEQSSYSVDEGSTVTVKVTLSANPERTVTIPINKTNQGGATTGDYSGVPDSVTFNSGETEQSITFMATDDTVDDDDEKVKLAFVNLPTRVSAGTPSEATVSITDDDDPEVDVSYEHSTYTVDEGSTVTVKAMLSADPERTVVIPLNKSNQNGTTDADYRGVPADLTFDSGEMEKSFTFTAMQDTVDDDDESVKLAFVNLPTRVSAGTKDETTVIITDDDVPTVTVRYEQSSYSVRESSTVTIKVILSADPERTVVIQISESPQGGASEDDYSGVLNSVTFNSGETAKSFTFRAILDDYDDDGESVILGFGTFPAMVSAGDPSTTTVRMLHEDPCGFDGRTGQEINYIDEQDRKFRKVFGPRLYSGYPEGDLLGWKEPLIGLYSLWCYRVEMRTRGEDESNYGAWQEFAAAVYDPPPPGNWTRINLGPRPSCTDRQYRVRAVYTSGEHGPWARSVGLLHRCGRRPGWWDW